MAVTSIRGTPLADLAASANIEDAVNPGFQALDDAPRYRRGSLVSIGDPAAYGRSIYEATDGANAGRWYFSTGAAWVEIVMAPIGTDDLADAVVTPAKLGVQPAAALTRSTAFSVSHNVSTTIPWQVESLEDETGMTDLTSNGPNQRVVVVTPGVYVPSACVSWAHNTTGRRVATLNHHRGGTTTPLASDQRTAVTTGSGATVNTPTGRPVRCLAGDYFTVTALQDSGGALDVRASTVEGTFLAAHRIGA